MVLNKLPVPGRPTYLEYNRTRAFCTCRRCGRGLLGHFFLSSITSFFFLPLSGRRPDIDWNIVSKGRYAKNNQPTNQLLKKDSVYSIWRENSVDIVMKLTRKIFSGQGNQKKT